jgi:hypothetical protein
MLAVGCTGTSQKGAPVTSPSPDFDSLTYTSGGGWMPFVSIADECSPSSTISVDSTGNYAFDGCVYNDQGLSQRVTAERQLSDAEMTQVTDALAEVEIGSSGNCGADKGVDTLTVQASDGTTENYLDDFYSCEPAPEGETYVTNIDVIGSALSSLRPDLPLVVLPLDELKLTSSGGMPMANQDATCSSYTSTLTLDVKSATLTWSLCDTTSEQGSRVLTKSELESVATKLATTTKTSSATCVEDIPTTTVTITRGSDAVTFADTETGCNDNAGAGEVFAENLAELWGLLRSLCAP